MRFAPNSRAAVGVRQVARIAFACFVAQPVAAMAFCSPSNVGAGALHLWPRSQSGALTVSAIGGQAVDMPLPGSGVNVRGASTAAFVLDCAHDDHWKVRFVFAVPPRHELEGTGSLVAVGVVGSGRQWSPALLLIHTFRAPQQTIRPFVGAGFDYTFFKQVRITNSAFRSTFFGPDATTTASASPSWNPAFVAGLSFRIDDRWSVEAAAIHAPVRTRLTVVADNTAAGAPITAHADLKNRAMIGFVTLNYRLDR
jgi:outer membrane protein